MIFTTLYYNVKPFLPRWLCLTARRWWAARRRASHAGVWPIDERAGFTPPGWPGWPEGKRFAFVLTHDVEGSKGLARVEALMNLDLKYGFRSSFNFVPEGEYRVPDALRDTLDRAGFEVGVHGLQHDGKLYSSKDRFASDAVRIKKYLECWNASGFRSPLMQHRLAWLHQIGVEYDASTFDTDPFEPEPDGVGTIFPFWVPGRDGDGYVELPYTLPQDFTLFGVLREHDIDTWKRKLDWIAARGGMALVNTHPDYMSFNEATRARDEYPASRYEDLLRYVQENHSQAIWTACPRDVARFYSARVPLASRNTRRKVCMLAYTGYESDNRVRRYAEALAKSGDQVDVVALSSGGNTLKTEIINGVSIYRIQHRERDEQGKWTYAWRVLRFLLASSVFLTRRHHEVRYDLIHVHNVPDFLVFAAWYPKQTDAKLILDIHDIVPELFASKFGGARPRYVRLLKRLESLSASFVDHVIVSNDLWYETLTSRSVPKEKASVFLNHVDPAIFYRRPRTRTDGKVVILFPGTFQWHQGLDIAIRALARLKNRVPGAELHLYGGGGGGNARTELAELANQLGLAERVKFFGPVALDIIPEVIANADLGVVPKRANSFGNEAYSTKIMEFMSQAVPVVLSRTKIDSMYFDNSVVRFFTSGDDEAMALAMLEVIENRSARESMVAKGLEYVERYSWERKKKDYLHLVTSLINQKFEDGRQPLS